jgi:predicted sugar kinase
VGREVGGGRVWGTFGIALEMSLRKIRNKKNWENTEKKENNAVKQKQNKTKQTKKEW